MAEHRPAAPATTAARRVLASGAVLVLLMSAAGCSRGVEIARAPNADAELCRRLSWPATVAGQDRVATRPDAAAAPDVAAWGDPAIIARCGVTSPGPTTDDCVAADGIDWVGRRLDDGMAFTTYGRSPAIEVLVPTAYAPEPLVLSAFAGTARVIPQGPRRCR